MSKKRKRGKNDKEKDKKRKMIITNELDVYKKLLELSIFRNKSKSKRVRVSSKETIISQLEDFCHQISNNSAIKYFIKLKIIEFENKNKNKDVNNMIMMIKEYVKGMVKEKVEMELEKGVKFEKENSCPISREIMKYPVVLKQTGQVYERDEIMKYLVANEDEIKKCPMTNVELDEMDSIEEYYVENYNRKGLIEKYKVEFVKKADLLFLIKEIHSNDEELINKGLEIIKMFKNYEMEIEKFEEYKLYDCVDEIIMSHEILLSLVNAPLNILIKSRFDLVKHYTTMEEYVKAKTVIEKKILNENINNEQKENALSSMIEIMQHCSLGNNNRREKRKLKKYVSDFIKVCVDNKHIKRGKLVFKKYEKKFFNDSSIESLLIKASMKINSIECAKIYLKIASTFYDDDEEYEQAEKYCKLAIENDESNVDAHKKMLEIFKVLDKPDEERQKCLDLVDLCDEDCDKLNYYQRAFDLDNTNDVVLKKYLQFCLDTMNVKKFKQLIDNTDTGVKVMFGEILKLKKKNNINVRKLRKLRDNNEKKFRKLSGNISNLTKQITDLQRITNDRKAIEGFQRNFVLIPFQTIHNLYYDKTKLIFSNNPLQPFSGFQFVLHIGWNSTGNVSYSLVNQNPFIIDVKYFIQLGANEKDYRTTNVIHKMLRPYNSFGSSFVVNDENPKKVYRYIRDNLVETFPDQRQGREMITVVVGICNVIFMQNPLQFMP